LTYAFVKPQRNKERVERQDSENGGDKADKEGASRKGIGTQSERKARNTRGAEG